KKIYFIFLLNGDADLINKIKMFMCRQEKAGKGIVVLYCQDINIRSKNRYQGFFCKWFSTNLSFSFHHFNSLSRLFWWAVCGMQLHFLSKARGHLPGARALP
uniref:Uncharacterized protein n=1 Tax=Sus scrofa TaxID=9823 RepID=A0A8D1TGK7_PIG